MTDAEAMAERILTEFAHWLVWNDVPNRVSVRLRSYGASAGQPSLQGLHCERRGVHRMASEVGSVGLRQPLASLVATTGQPSRNARLACPAVAAREASV